MPYTIKRVANKWFVERLDGVRFGAHDCEGDASRQLKALEALAPKPKLIDLRALHLHRALGTAKIETINGREHLIVPVIALMEGVIHAVNAETPEFVPLSTLQKAAASWNGKPVTLGHPKKDGKQCSAAGQDIIDSHGLGFIRNSRVEGTKLLQEACIDKVKAKQLDPDMWQRLLEDKWEEVSVGAFVVTDNKPGKYTNGKAFNGTWLDTAGDHLAFLPGGRGACSIEMGCGAHRAAMRVCEAGLELELETQGGPGSGPHPGTRGSLKSLTLKACTAYSVLEGFSLNERIDAVNDAINKRWNTSDNGSMPGAIATAEQVFDNSVIVEIDETYYAVPYDVADDGTVTLGKATEVKQTYVAASHGDCHCGGACDECQEHRTAAAKMVPCETCDGTGQVKGDDGKQGDCPTCDGEGKLRAAAGARHSVGDMKLIQTVHDHAVSLGAACDRGNM
jgi:Zn finger protein HypA/HybF involved in hydrogenase expression